MQNQKIEEPGPTEKVILLVDDEPSITGFLSVLLKMNGYKVVSFNDSIEALNAFRQSPKTIDLVITDQTMPGLTGLELTLEILLLRPAMPIILVTGFSEKLLHLDIIQLGISAFMKKPFNNDLLIETVSELLAA
ncbi:MAG: response regulator [Pseudohongiella sp.]|nr:response regulator [Pseudohongiella sp.]